MLMSSVVLVLEYAGVFISNTQKHEWPLLQLSFFKILFSLISKAYGGIHFNKGNSTYESDNFSKTYTSIIHTARLGSCSLHPVPRGFLFCAPLFLSRLMTWVGSFLGCPEITVQFLLREVSKLSVTRLGGEDGFNSVSLFTALRNLQGSTL